MIPRTASSALHRLAKGFPVIVLTGPRQSGKTTLAKAAFADKPYVSLENPEERETGYKPPKNGEPWLAIRRCRPSSSLAARKAMSGKAAG